MDYAQTRRNMVEGQLRTNRITDARLLDVFEAVPRERFVPDALRHAAYADEAVAMGRGLFMLEPLVLARLVQSLAITQQDKVLVLGSNSGYGLAVVAALANAVYAIEEDAALNVTAAAVLHDVGVQNAQIFTSNPAQGYAAEAPYQAILIEGAVQHLPDSLLAQLAEGGRVAYVEHVKGGLGHITLGRKVNGHMVTERLFDAGVAVLPSFAAKKEFVF